MSFCLNAGKERTSHHSSAQQQPTMSAEFKVLKTKFTFEVYKQPPIMLNHDKLCKKWTVSKPKGVWGSFNFNCLLCHSSNMCRTDDI